MADDRIVILETVQSGSITGGSNVLEYVELGDSYIINNFNNGLNIAIDFEGFVKENDLIADIRVRDSSLPKDDTNQSDLDFCFQLEILSNMYPSDISWEIEEVNSGVVVHQQDYEKVLDYESRQVCLKYDTQYKYTIFDSYGDGICCGDKGQPWNMGYMGDGHYRAFTYYYENNAELELFPPGGVLANYCCGYGDKDERIFTTPPILAPTAIPMMPSTATPMIPPTDVSPPTSPCTQDENAEFLFKKS